MKNFLRDVTRYSSTGFGIPVLSVETDVDMKMGMLYGLKDGKAVLADQATDVCAIGITVGTSLEGFGEAFKFQNIEDAVLRKGEYIDVYTQGILFAEEVVGKGAVGDPVYLGAGGLITLEKPVANTVQVVGAIANNKTGAVRLMILTNGKENA